MIKVKHIGRIGNTLSISFKTISGNDVSVVLKPHQYFYTDNSFVTRSILIQKKKNNISIDQVTSFDNVDEELYIKYPIELNIESQVAQSSENVLEIDINKMLADFKPVNSIEHTKEAETEKEQQPEKKKNNLFGPRKKTDTSILDSKRRADIKNTEITERIKTEKELKEESVNKISGIEAEIVAEMELIGKDQERKKTNKVTAKRLKDKNFKPVRQSKAAKKSSNKKYVFNKDNTIEKKTYTQIHVDAELYAKQLRKGKSKNNKPENK